MRMWMIDPKLLCRKHLLGEHNELHKHLPSFRKGVRVNGRFAPIIQIQFRGYKERHDKLVSEMLRRGYNHKSPLNDIPDFQKIYPHFYYLKVNKDVSKKDLAERCPDCKRRIDMSRRTDYE